ncbi:MAG: hypothetical protein JSR85_07445 [Proteobacteria bacterium]|nr:hypothetical protein [Pseudomonadota bacterium]
MNVLKKSFLVSTALLWGAYGVWAMGDNDGIGHAPPKLKDDVPNEYERSNSFKSYAVETRDFEAFKTQCDERLEERVMVFGANSCNGFYKDNIFKVDLIDNPDLFMNTDIDPLPEKYIGQFDVVVFECICSSETSCKNYERAKAFPNVKKLLKPNGLFLVWTDDSDDVTNQRDALEGYGFSFKERIKRHKISILGKIDEDPPRSCCDNIYLEPNGDEIKYTVMTPGERDIEGTLTCKPNLAALFSRDSDYPHKRSIETEIVNELIEKGHISRLSHYKDYLGGRCVSNYCDLLVTESR